MNSPFLGELLGTAVLIFLGNGVVAGVLLRSSKAEGGGWIVVTAGWAFAVLSGVFTALACGSPYAHLNPAVTLGFALVTRDASKIAPYFVAQTLGAMLGATLVWLHYLPHWKETPDPAAKLACFSTRPAIRNLPLNFLSEALATFMLVFVVGAIFSKHAAGSGFAPGIGPYLIASLVWGIGLSLGGTTGYAINPARDLGPRLMHAVLPVSGKGGSDWGYAIVPIAGPLLGGLLAGLAMKFLNF